MRAKHTTGPWHNSGGCVRDEHDRDVAVVQRKREWEPGAGDIPEREIQEIGDLIAAAPDLLKALRDVLTSGAAIDLSYKENRDTFDAAIRDGWDAIAKSEGR